MRQDPQGKRGPDVLHYSSSRASTATSSRLGPHLKLILHSPSAPPSPRKEPTHCITLGSSPISASTSHSYLHNSFCLPRPSTRGL